MSLDATATLKVFSWALLPPITVLFIATPCAAVWGHNNLVLAHLVGGDAGDKLLAGVEDPLRPLGCLPRYCQLDGLVQRHVLLSEEVLLQLQVVDPVDE